MAADPKIGAKPKEIMEDVAVLDQEDTLPPAEDTQNDITAMLNRARGIETEAKPMPETQDIDITDDAPDLEEFIRERMEILAAAIKDGDDNYVHAFDDDIPEYLRDEHGSIYDPESFQAGTFSGEKAHRAESSSGDAKKTTGNHEKQDSDDNERGLQRRRSIVNDLYIQNFINQLTQQAQQIFYRTYEAIDRSITQQTAKINTIQAQIDENNTEIESLNSKTEDLQERLDTGDYADAPDTPEVKQAKAVVAQAETVAQDSAVAVAAQEEKVAALEEKIQEQAPAEAKLTEAQIKQERVDALEAKLADTLDEPDAETRHKRLQAAYGNTVTNLGQSMGADKLLPDAAKKFLADDKLKAAWADPIRDGQGNVVYNDGQGKIVFDKDGNPVFSDLYHYDDAGNRVYYTDPEEILKLKSEAEGIDGKDPRFYGNETPDFDTKDNSFNDTRTRLLDKEAETIEKQANDQRKIVEGINTQLTDLKEDLALEKKKLADLQTQKTQHDAELQQAKDQLAKLEAGKTQDGMTKAEIEAQIKANKAKVEELTQQNTQLSTQLDEETAKLDTMKSLKEKMNTESFVNDYAKALKDGHVDEQEFEKLAKDMSAEEKALFRKQLGEAGAMPKAEKQATATLMAQKAETAQPASEMQTVSKTTEDPAYKMKYNPSELAASMQKIDAKLADLGNRDISPEQLKELAKEHGIAEPDLKRMLTEDRDYKITEAEPEAAPETKPSLMTSFASSMDKTMKGLSEAWDKATKSPAEQPPAPELASAPKPADPADTMKSGAAGM